MPTETKQRECDLAIVGAGFSGLAAAKRAFQAGRNFCLVARDFGATRHFSGAFDLVDPRWNGMTDRQAFETGLKRHVSDFVAAHPGHLYAALSSGDAAAFAVRLLAEMRSFLDFYTIPYRGDGERPVAVFGSSGRVKPAAFAMATQALAAEDLEGAVAFAGFPFVTEYPSAEIAKNLGRLFSSVIPVEIPDWPVNRISALASLEWRFDHDDGVVGEFADALRGRLGGARTLFIPPILGRRRYLENHAALQKALGVRVVELLSALPSAAGSRFCDAAERVLSENNIEFIRGEVFSPEISDREVRSVLVLPPNRSPAEALRVVAREFVLASGKFIGGGVIHRGSFKEPLFKLPLHANGEPIAETTNVIQMIAANGAAPQPFSSMGLAIDEEGRPAYRGRPVYPNLKACGHVLGGFDFTRERCGFGASVASAMRIPLPCPKK